MDLDRLRQHWDAWGRQDAMYAVLTDPAKRHNRWDADAFFATGRQEIAGVLADLRRLDAMPATTAALDFGCGVGRLTQALAGRFDSVVGVDIAATMVARAEAYNRFPGRCRYAVNAADDLSRFADASFDFVYCNIVLQHMRPDFAHGYVREFFRVLRPGGIAVFFLPEAPVPARGPSFGPPARQRAKIAVRSLVNAVSRGVCRRVALPQIEMYGTPRPVVERSIRAAGGTLVDVVADPSAGDGWTGYRYCCRRTGRP